MDTTLEHNCSQTGYVCMELSHKNAVPVDRVVFQGLAVDEDLRLPLSEAVSIFERDTGELESRPWFSSPDLPPKAKKKKKKNYG